MQSGPGKKASHPVRAIIMGGAFAVGLWISPRDLMAFTAILGLLLVALSWIDFDTFRLPNPLTFATAALGVVMVSVARQDVIWQHLVAGAVAYSVLVGVELLYRALRKKDGLGRGDAKLFGAIGIWIGPLGLPPALLLASATGLVYALLQGGARRMDTKVPFGPWLSLGGWTVWCAGTRLIPGFYSV